MYQIVWSFLLFSFKTVIGSQVKLPPTQQRSLFPWLWSFVDSSSAGTEPEAACCCSDQRVSQNVENYDLCGRGSPLDVILYHLFSVFDRNL